MFAEIQVFYVETHVVFLKRSPLNTSVSQETEIARTLFWLRFFHFQIIDIRISHEPVLCICYFTKFCNYLINKNISNYNRPQKALTM